jgi:thioester reductase-like protein
MSPPQPPEAMSAPQPTSPPPRSGRVVLLTGATGLLGKVVLDELLRRRHELGLERVLLLVRAPDAEGADARLRTEVVASPCFRGQAPGWEKRVEALAGDVTRPGLGLDRESAGRARAEATHLIHCAASVDFELPLAEATAVNATGALHALDVARGCARLESFAGVSTAYATPHPAPGRGRTHRVEETLVELPGDPDALYAAARSGAGNEARLLAETGHPNTYTFTKCLAEHLLAQRAGDLPVSLVRPSIISASRRHPAPGWIDSPAAFASFVALIGTGRLRVVAGDPEVRLDLVPCDEVARRVVDAAFDPLRPGAVRIRHAVAGLAGAPPVGLCRERILRYFGANRGAGGPRLAWVGPAGPRFSFEHLRRHELPGHAAALRFALARRPGRARAARRLLARQRSINRGFAYFTHATFDFRSSVPLHPALDPAAYLDTVCEGVDRHLLRREGRRPREL